MPDIFISYKKEERAVASQLATRLTQQGYDVWWDAALLAGERFEDEISGVLSTSRAVVVLWSRKSVDSEWVKAEAEAARSQKKALPAVIDDLPMESLPLLYRGLHVCHLRGWTGEADHPGYAELMNAIAERCGKAKGPALSGTEAEAKLAESVGEAEVWAAIAAGNDPSADEYRAYLKRFGPDARFAELAHIRIARIEERERGTRPKPVADKSTADKPAGRGLRWGLIAASVVILALLGGALGWFWPKAVDMLTPEAVKEAAARCTTWSNGVVLDWTSTLPVSTPAVAADCETAATKYAKNGDYKAMLAMVRLQQGSEGADEAIALTRDGIDLKSGLASYVMGVMYNQGLNLQADVGRAASYYKAAFEAGVPRGAARLCMLAANSGGTLPFSTDAAAILQYCRSASDAGDALGQLALGYFYEYGDLGLGVDDNKAEALYKLAADQGSPLGQLRLGVELYRGVGSPPDPNRAFTLISQAADSGLPAALRWLAIAYERGIGVVPNVPRAAQLYETAAIRRDNAALMLAGYGVAAAPLPQPDDRELERIAADQSSAVGQRMLAQMFERGHLRAVDTVKANEILQQCTDAGSSFCQQQLGYNYEYGYGVSPRDPVKALALFQASADQGNMYGQYWVAFMYDNGEGVAKDNARAVSYYQMAAAQGHWSAINRLKELGVAASAASPKS